MEDANMVNSTVLERLISPESLTISNDTEYNAEPIPSSHGEIHPNAIYFVASPSSNLEEHSPTALTLSDDSEKSISFKPIENGEIIVAHNLINEILVLRKFGNDLLRDELCSTKQILAKSVDYIRERLKVQVVSVFLISKSGLIERVKISGCDKDKQEIRDNWLEKNGIKENYKPGDSFSGKAAKAEGDNPYGKVYYSNSLEDEDEIDFNRYGQHYKDKLGRLECGISVPLNGSQRTFGTLEVINKTKQGELFTQAEIIWLTVVASHVAMALSKCRARERDLMSYEIAKILTISELNSNYTTINHKSVYKQIADRLVSPSTPYTACIIRLCMDDGSIVVVDKAHADGDLEGFKDRIDDHRHIDQNCLVSQVVTHGELIQINNISENDKNKFCNWQWVKKQNFKSFICLPLKIDEKNVVGTLSLFVSFEFTFDQTDIDFLENITNLLAAFKIRSDRHKETEYNGSTTLYNSNMIPLKDKLDKPDKEKFKDLDLDLDYNQGLDYIEKQSEIFEQYKSKLLADYENQFVLFENGEVLDSGTSRVEIAMRAYKNGGMRPLFIEKVTSRIEPLKAVWTPFSLH